MENGGLHGKLVRELNPGSYKHYTECQYKVFGVTGAWFDVLGFKTLLPPHHVGGLRATQSLYPDTGPTSPGTVPQNDRRLAGPLPD